MSLDVTKYDNKQPTSSKIKTEFKAGTQMGRIARIVCTGLQHQTMWDEKTKSSKGLYWKPKEEQVKGANNQTYVDTGNPVTNVIFKVTVEFPSVRAKNEDGEDIGSAWLSKDYNPRSKQLTALLEVTGGTDAEALLNMPVMCPIGFSSGGNAKIMSIAAAPEGVPVAELENGHNGFNIYEPDRNVWEKLPKFVQDECKNALDFKKTKLYDLLNSGPVPGVDDAPQHNDNTDDDSRPF